MINLLPEKEKALIYREYKLRVIAVILGTIFCVCIIAIILLSPSYILSLYRMKAAETAAQIPEKKTDNQQAALMATVEKGKSALVVLKPENPGKLPTEAITYIVKNKTPEISITSIQYSYQKPDTFLIQIIGKAKTRQSLIEFKAALEKEQGIEQIVLPVSSLAKDSNINFVLDIKNKK